MVITRSWPASITRSGYWLAVAVPLLLPLGYGLRDVPWLGAGFAWLTPLVLFGLLPIADALLGRDTRNPDTTEGDWTTDTVVPVAAAASYFTVLAWSVWIVAAQPGAFSALDRVGWTLSLAIVGGVIAINVAHELIHRRTRALQNLGGALLAAVAYGCFKLEHPRWHHVKVATPEDPSSAARGDNVYFRVPCAVVLNTICGWQLGAEAARRAGRPAWQNEMMGWYGLTLGLALLIFTALGTTAGLVYAGHAIGAIVLLEIINYVEHYGLRRARREDGRWEPPRTCHSWDADFWLSNALLIQLPRHADHHVNPGRPFARLQRTREAPQMPFGYSTAVLLALVPPLWWRVMDPRIPD